MLETPSTGIGKSFPETCMRRRHCSVLFVVLSTIGILAFLTVSECRALSPKETRSGDAYIRFDESAKAWAIGTSVVEEKLELSAGSFILVELRNRLSGRDFISNSNRSEEFRITAEGAVRTGLSGQWLLKSSEITVLKQGEIQLVVRLESDPLQVEKTYVVYPHTGIIRQWVSFKNISSHSIKVSNPYFLSDRFEFDEAAKPTLLQALKDRRLTAVLFLSFASGLPFNLTGFTLQAWLASEGGEWAEWTAR